MDRRLSHDIASTTPSRFLDEEISVFAHHRETLGKLSAVAVKIPAAKYLIPCVTDIIEQNSRDVGEFIRLREVLRHSAHNSESLDQQERSILGEALNATDDIVRGMANIRSEENAPQYGNE